MGFGTVLTQFWRSLHRKVAWLRGSIGRSGLESVRQKSRGVAQPGSAPALGAGGRRFKSSRPDQLTLCDARG